RVLDAGERDVRDGLQGVPDAGVAADRSSGVVESGRLRLPRRVDPCVAGPGGAGAPDRRCRVVGGAMAQPRRRHRCAARRDQTPALKRAVVALRRCTVAPCTDAWPIPTARSAPIPVPTRVWSPL